MKNLVILLSLALLPIWSIGQTSAEELHRKYSKNDDFTSFSISGSFLKDLDLDVEDDDIEKKVTGDINEIKLLSYCQKEHGEINFRKIALEHLTGRGYKEVLKEKERCKNSDELHFYAKGRGKRFSEFHVLHSNENRTSLVSFFGDFKVEDLEALSEMGMNKIEN